MGVHSGSVALFDFDNSYARLGSQYSTQLRPTPVPAPRLVRLNTALATELGVNPERLSTDLAVAVFAGNQIPEGSIPIAQVDAGHQFGSFVPQLGDGRALLLGELVGDAGRRRDVQLKGSGPTPYSRGGDGRATLGPVLREFLVSEAMHAHVNPTTRALAAVTTGELVRRERPLPGAILTRVAASHLRVGTIQYFAARGDDHAVRTLVDYALERHYPELVHQKPPALALLRAVMKRQAELIARWLGVGFIHGVMNTDNTALSGETIDFGPCAFMDEYDPATVFSSIDRHGRYAYAAQPSIAAWNMARLAEALLPAIAADPELAVDQASTAVREFPDLFATAWAQEVRRKLGLQTEESDDMQIWTSLLDLMEPSRADFTNTMRSLADAALSSDADAEMRQRFADPLRYDEWVGRWRARLAIEGDSPNQVAARLRQTNPAYIPRNHRVEAALDAAIAGNDFGPFETLISILMHPYDEQPENVAYRTPPTPAERVCQTFCGT